MPRAIRCQGCPQSKKATENQYYIHVAAGRGLVVLGGLGFLRPRWSSVPNNLAMRHQTPPRRTRVFFRPSAPSVGGQARVSIHPLVKRRRPILTIPKMGQKGPFETGIHIITSRRPAVRLSGFRQAPPRLYGVMVFAIYLLSSP